jgi:hypothetical protein
VWESGCIDPRFVDFGTNWRWAVSFVPLLLYLRGMSLRYPLDRTLSGTPEPVWMIRRSENYWPYWESNSDPSVVQPVAGRYTDWATAALITWWVFAKILATHHVLLYTKYKKNILKITTPTNICRNLRTQEMSVLVLLCTSYTTCFDPYWWPSSGGL